MVCAVLNGGVIWLDILNTRTRDNQTLRKNTQNAMKITRNPHIQTTVKQRRSCLVEKYSRAKLWHNWQYSISHEDTETEWWSRTQLRCQSKPTNKTWNHTSPINQIPPKSNQHPTEIWKMQSYAWCNDLWMPQEHQPGFDVCICNVSRYSKIWWVR